MKKDEFETDINSAVRENVGRDLSAKSEFTEKESLDRIADLKKENETLRQEVQNCRLVEEKLRYSEQTAQALLNANHESAFLITPEGVALAMNKVSAERMGRRVEDLIGKNLFDFISRDLAESRRAKLKELLRTGESLRWVDERDGIILDQTIYPIRGESGDIDRIAIYARDITAKVTAEDALKMSEASLAKAQDIAGIGNWTWDIASGEVTWSLTAYRLLELNPGDIGSDYKSFLKLIHDDDRERIVKSLAAALFDEIPFDEEFTLVKPYGGSLVIHALAEIVADEAGEPALLIGTMQDISQRKKAEEELRKSEAGLAEAQRIARIGNFEWNLETGELYWSDEFFRILGVEPQSFSPSLDVFFSFLHPDDLVIFQSSIESLLIHGVPRSIEYRIIDKSKNVRWIHADSEVFRDGNGDIAYLKGTFQDVTERIKAEEIARELAVIVEYSDDAIFSASLEGTIKTWNSGAEKLFGYSSSEAVGSSLGLLSAPDAEIDCLKIIDMMRAGEKVERHEVIAAAKDGRKIYVSLIVSPIYKSNGDIVSASLIGRDVTDRKLAENELRIKEKAIQTATDAIILTDPEGEVTYVNQSFLKIWGYDEQRDVNGRLLSDFMAEPTRLLMLKREILKEGGWIGELKALGKDGHPFDIQVVGSRVIDDEGETTCLMYSAVDVTERKRIEELLRIQAIYDELTGLFNRRHFMEKLQAEIADAVRYRYPLCVAILDLDHFKSVNDEYGHQAGDDVLAEFGKLVAERLRAGDVAGRYGGEEFAVALPHTQWKDAVKVLERIRKEFEEMSFSDGKGGGFSVTSSFGIAEIDSNSAGIEQILDRADKALYKAKRKGRNRVEVYGEEAV